MVMKQICNRKALNMYRICNRNATFLTLLTFNYGADIYSIWNMQWMPILSSSQIEFAPCIEMILRTYVCPYQSRTVCNKNAVYICMYSIWNICQMSILPSYHDHIFLSMHPVLPAYSFHTHAHISFVRYVMKTAYQDVVFM